jgi:flavin-dependent dehydrogenase
MVTVGGGGPAGAAAALAALAEGVAVEVRDRAAFPRHKVCGEFLSPESLPVLAALGADGPVLARQPAWIRRVRLVMGVSEKTAVLPEPALGISRHALDWILLAEFQRRGGRLVRGEARPLPAPAVDATGRGAHAARAGAKPGRLFGFKAHFRGPVNDAVELFFWDGCYVGVNPVEDGLTNVCGLAPHARLAAFGFDPGALLANAGAAVRARLAPLRQEWDWIRTGPLVFARRCGPEGLPEGVYPAGDALSFVDPFTGSGQLCALVTGRLSGRAAARRTPLSEYFAETGRALGRAAWVAGWVRRALASGVPGWLARLAPATAIYRWTRPDLRL